MSDLKLQLDGFRLATAEILYHLPDYPDLLQSYIWQDYDHLPDFPVLHRFLDFWDRTLEGRLHSVTLASVDCIRPQEYAYLKTLIKLH